MIKDSELTSASNPMFERHEILEARKPGTRGLL